MGRTFVFLPPLRTISGGLAVLLDTAALLAATGHDILFRAGKIIVQADDVATPGNKTLAQMRTKEAGAAGDENAFFQVHGLGLEHSLE